MPLSLVGNREQTLMSCSVLAKKLEFAIKKPFDVVAPLRRITIKFNHKPWVTTHIRGLMQKRDKAYQRAMKIRKPVDREKFRQLRREISNQLDTAKSSFIRKKIDEAPNVRSKSFEINKLGLIKKQNPLLSFTASGLNQHYASVSNSNSPLNEIDVQDIVASHSLTPNCTSFDFIEVSDANVLKVIASMSSK